jgi:hypothetical protein
LIVDTDGKTVSYFQLRETTENKALIDLAYDQIVLPTTNIPSTVVSSEAVVGKAVVGNDSVANETDNSSK